MLQGVDSSAASFTSLSLQFSSDGLQWHDYLNSLPNTVPPPMVLSTSVPTAIASKGLSFPWGTVLALDICETPAN